MHRTSPPMSPHKALAVNQSCFAAEAPTIRTAGLGSANVKAGANRIRLWPPPSEKRENGNPSVERLMSAFHSVATSLPSISDARSGPAGNDPIADNLNIAIPTDGPWKDSNS